MQEYLETLKEGIALLVVVLLVVILLTLAVRGLQAECWQDTLDELDPITATTTIGIGKCIGRDEFSTVLTMKPSCVDRVSFSTYDRCIAICNEKRALDEEGESCFNACQQCKNHAGCIVAVPIKPSWWDNLRSLNPVRIFSGRLGTVTTYATGEYGFASQAKDPVEFRPKDNVEVMCLDFKRGTGQTMYAITARLNSSRNPCEVTICTPQRQLT